MIQMHKIMLSAKKNNIPAQKIMFYASRVLRQQIIHY